MGKAEDNLMAGGGAGGRGARAGGRKGRNGRHGRSEEGGGAAGAGAGLGRLRAAVPSHHLPTDVSGVAVEQQLLQGAWVTAITDPVDGWLRPRLEELVKQLGGRYSMGVSVEVFNMRSKF